jgi:type 1 glutamine amidotransferase
MNTMKFKHLFIIAIASSLSFQATPAKTPYKTLIITGQNNHNWKASSPVLKQILDQTGLFSCEIITTPEKGGNMSSFNPDFSQYSLVVLDYNGDSWTEKTSNAFFSYVKNGGAVVVYHAADNAFPESKEYNKIIGLGGWGNRTERDGPYVYYRNNKLVVDNKPGTGGSHGKRREYVVRTRKPDHPIMKGLPESWMHGNDELYSQLRGPAENLEILATAFADSAAGGGTMRDEPMLMTITYGKGRVFHTAMGHADEGGGPAMHCAGFITTLQRGAEWAVTGNVTQSVPWDFPSSSSVVIREGVKPLTLDQAFKGIGEYTTGESARNLSCIQSAIRAASGNTKILRDLEKRMISVLQKAQATPDSKKVLLKELSWMGSQQCVPAVKNLVNDPNLKDEAEYTLTRLGSAR